MPEYLAPGVYVEEIKTGPRPIEGVSTSTAGFVGETERGPTRPTLVTSWEDYTRRYGGHIDRPPFNSTHPFLPYAVKGFFDNSGQRLFVARVVGAGAVAAAGDLGNGCAVAAVGEGASGNNILVAVKTASAAQADAPTADWFRLQVAYYRDGIPNPFVDPTDPATLADPNRVEPTMFEDFDNLSVVTILSNFAISVVNAGSQLIAMTACPAAPAAANFPGVQLRNGAANAATLTEYVDAAQTDPEKRRGLAGLAMIKELSLLAAPDEVVVNGLREEVINACESTKDRFAVTSADGNISNNADPGFRPPRDTTCAGFYYPWVRVLAPHTDEGHRLIPATGHVVGIYARVDVERGVHKAPANEVVRGIATSDLENNKKKPLEFTLGKREHDVLNQRGVNVIRDFRAEGRDIRVWGARTMSSDSMWKYINVRRLFIYIEQSIDRGTQWAVFEPNSEPTWIAIRTSIINFLRTVWRDGALIGTTQEEAFFVKCDRTTMTQDDLDNGRLICLIGVAPVKPAEFVIFRISQKTMEAGAG
jgi:phage tail sheath protein FI